MGSGKRNLVGSVLKVANPSVFFLFFLSAYDEKWPSAVCGLSLLLVVSLVRGFFSGLFGLLSPQKKTAKADLASS